MNEEGTENNGMNQVKGLKEGLGGRQQDGQRTKGGGQSTAAAGVGEEEREADRLEMREGPGHTGPGGGPLIMPGLHPRGNGKPLKWLTSWEHGTP